MGAVEGGSEGSLQAVVGRVSGRRGQWEEGSSSREDWSVRGWVSWRRVGQMESGTMAGELESKRRLVN